MMDVRATKNVVPYYPEAMRASFYVRLFLLLAKYQLEVSEKHVAFLTSICSDDINNVRPTGPGPRARSSPTTRAWLGDASVSERRPIGHAAVLRPPRLGSNIGP
jgi:hypothetical protein